MSTAKRQNIAGGCKREFTLETEKLLLPFEWNVFQIISIYHHKNFKITISNRIFLASIKKYLLLHLLKVGIFETYKLAVCKFKGLNIFQIHILKILDCLNM